MLKGEFEIVIRDVYTGEVVQSFKEPNIVTDVTFEAWNSSGYVGGGVAPIISGTLVANKKVCEPTRAMRYIPSNTQSNDAYVGTAIPGVSSPEYFPAAGAVPPFGQWSTRLGLPTLGTSHTINSVMMTNSGGQGYLNQTGFSSDGPAQIYAFAKLSTPCVQTDSQFFDLYYRIYFENTMLYDMPVWVFDSMARRMIGMTDVLVNSTTFRQVYLYHSAISLPQPVAKTTADKERVYLSRAGFSHWSADGSGDNVNTTTNISAGTYYRRKYSQSLTFDNLVGKAIGNKIFSSGDGFVITAWNNLGDSLPKIQTLIGHRATSNRPFFDIDNLQQGTGQITLSGTWNNRGTPSVAGMYATGKLPEMKYIIISGGGATGVAGYKYRTRPFINFWFTIGHFNQYYEAAQEVPALCSSTALAEHGHTLLGTLSTFGIRQLSSCCRYDDTSVVMVKTNEIVLYNVATGGYWIYTGTFTDVRQVAVVSGKIYLSCNNTGLHVIDPVNSDTVTATPTPAVGIDCSVTHGVARGYNNTLWVVGNNCLAKYDGSTWTKYDSTTTPAITMTGVTNSLWSNIEYLVVDETSSDNQMLLVRKYDASADPTLLGVWWSTVGTTTNSFAETKGGYVSNVRLNRSHVGGRGGNWVLRMNSALYRCTFGQTTAPTIIASTTVTTNNWNHTGMLGSVMWVQNASAQWRVLCMTNKTDEQILSGGGPYLTDFETFKHPEVRIVDPATGTSETAVTGTLTYSVENNAPMHISYIESSQLGGTPNQFLGDLQISFVLKKGVLFHTATYGSTNQDTSIRTTKSFAVVYPYSGNTYAGGPLAYLGDTNYGWNGSAWVEGNANARTTHTSPQTLADGVSLAFADGAAGTAWVDTDYYTFGVYEGLLKDNASTATFEHSFYYKRAYTNQTALSGATTIPVATTLGSGLVTLDAVRSCNTTAVSTNGSNQFVFAGENHGQYAVGVQQVTGLFQITYTPTSDTLCRGVYFGVGYGATHGLLYYFEVDVNGTVFVNRAGGSRISIGATTSNTLSIRRTSTTQIDFLSNGVVLATGTVAAGLLRFDLLYMTQGDWQPQYMIANRLTPATTITTNGSDVSLKIGSSGAFTGAYNPKFYAIDDDTRGALTMTIDGIAVSAIRKLGEAPNPGEVSVQPHMGLFQFHSADVGKSVAATYNYMTHE